MKIKILLQSKLTTTVKKFTRYNDRSRVAVKQTNKKVDSETQKLANIQTEKQKKKYLQIETQADLQSTYAHREVNTKLKKEVLCSTVIETNKYYIDK